MRIFFAFLFLALSASVAEAEHLWVNNITVNESDMTWGYTETFSRMDAIAYRIGIDMELGNNDSFISAWEALKADKEVRKMLRDSINKELDVRINNETAGIEVLDVDSKLSQDLIGKTHLSDAVVDRYNVTYRFKNRIFNASSIWFLGQPESPVTIVMPAGIDVVNVSGMQNVTRKITDHTEISGFFAEKSKDRGEITLDLARNTSFRLPELNASLPGNVTITNVTKPVSEVVSKIRDATFIIGGAVLIILIYVFKVRRR